MTCKACERVAVAKGLCARHYSQNRRGQTLTPGRTAPGAGASATFRTERSMLELVAGLAEVEAITPSEWLRRALEERADRQLEALADSGR